MTMSFTSWKLDSGVEPVIRVGTVLPFDDLKTTTLTVKNQPCIIYLDGKDAGPFAGGSIEASIEADRVVLTKGAQRLGAARVVELKPAAGAVLASGCGIQVRDALTGRGFHWQKRFDPVLGGIVELQVRQERLVVINVLTMEDYLTGVITGEMSGECPLEFLKSQCVVARSWVLAHTENKHSELPVDRCNDDCCQRYHGTTNLTPRAVEAVRSTRGQVILHSSGVIIDANYSKSCGGIIETPEYVWNVSKSGQRAEVDAPKGSAVRRFMPVTEGNLDEYLTGGWLASTDAFCSPTVVPDADLPKYLGKVDDGGGHFRWRFEYSRAQLEAILREKLFGKYLDSSTPAMAALKDLRVLRRGLSGRAADLEVEYLDAAGKSHCVKVETEYRIRDCLHEKFLYSSAFKIEMQRDSQGLPSKITLVGAGWGHGAGLCQIGALGMAMRGYTCEQILTHYFDSVRIHACY